MRKATQKIATGVVHKVPADLRKALASDPKALVKGTVEMPMAESPWGTYFAMFRDKYGIEWTVEFDPKNN